MKMTASVKADTIRMLVALIQKGKDAYYKGGVAKITQQEIPKQFAGQIKPGLMDDPVFNSVEDALASIDPDNKILSTVGSEEAINKKLKVKLPFFMASLRKGKPDGSMHKWLDDHPGPYVLSFKYDGVSLLCVYKPNKPVKVYTRGKNNIGGDISFLAPYLKIPQVLPYELVVRGEAVMTEAKFKKWERQIGSEEKNKYSNARGMVAGITNRTSAHPGLADIDVIMYDVYVPRYKPSMFFPKLKAAGFHPATSMTVTNLTVQKLQSLLKQARSKAGYAVDGIVVVQDKKNPIAESYPDHAVAFKDEGQQEVAKVKITKVDWGHGRTGIWFPTIFYEPVKLGGVICKQVSAKSGQYIYDNKLGPGAVIEIIRSGDVIPKIVGVVRQAKAPQMPNVEYEWRGANIYSKAAAPGNERTLEQKIKTLSHFFASIGVERFKGATIAKFVEAGHDTVRKIIQMPAHKFTSVPGCSPKVLQGVMEQIDNAITDIDLPVLMAASSMFGGGFGVTLCQDIVRAIPNIMEIYDHPDLVSKVAAVDNFGPQRAKQFAANLARFVKWVNSVPQITWRVPAPKRAIKGKLTGQVVVFTKIRDAQLESQIKATGGEIGGSVTGKTTVVIAPAGESSTKLDAARAKGIPVLTIDQFRKKFSI